MPGIQNFMMFPGVVLRVHKFHVVVLHFSQMGATEALRS